MARAQLFVISCELCGVSCEWMLLLPGLVDYRFVYVQLGRVYKLRVLNDT